jgi:pilus assembly protein Flp/PilA
MLDTLIHSIRRRLSRDEERGASVVEYGLLIAAVAALVVVAAFAIGNWANNSFNETCDELAAAGADPACDAPADPAGGG